MKYIERSKDGVPQWDGDATTFQEYSELASHWQESIPYHKRYLCGPRLQAELSGTARRFVQAKQPGWISHPNGVDTLLQHLRQNLGQPQLSEMAEYLAKYFKQSKRRRHESMNDYITRKAELYSRACQTLGRLQKRYEPRSSEARGSTTSTQPAPQPSTPALTNNQEQQEPDGTDSEHSEFHEAENEPNPGNDGWEDWWQQDHRQHWRQSQDWWGWNDPWSQWTNTASVGASSQWDRDEAALLPDFVQGWLLLQDSGLETSERNSILSALKGNFSLSRVAQELRNQWQDDDIKKRDGGGRSAAWCADYEDGAFMGDMEGQYESPDWAYLTMAGLSEDGFAILEETDASAHEALAAIERGRRTLREAREKQHQVKMNRQFYSSRPWPRRQPQARQDAPGTRSITCLRCGGPHRADECPKKDSKAMVTHTEEAPFVCFAEDQAAQAACISEEQDRALAVTTQEATEQGKAVIDGGATRTLASVAALEKIMEINSNTKGETGLHRLDPELRPTFGFGNSSSDQCLSTAWMKISAGGRNGQLKIHALDKGSGPVLFSVETLRSLGAVIDFSEDLIVFRQLDPTRVIKMERSCTGHQLLPMTEDWFQNASQASSPVRSLKQYI